MRVRHTCTAIAVASIWLAVILTSIFARDFVSGTQQEHIPIAAIANWFWGSVSTGFVLLAMAMRRGANEGQDQVWVVFAVVIAVIWGAVTITSIFAPDVTTGTDPTRFPVAAMVGPIAATVATGFVAGFVAFAGRDAQSQSRTQT